MSSEAIIADLERTTAAEVEAILARGRAQAAAVVTAAREEVAARVEAAVARAEPRARADAGRRTTAARVRLLEARAALDADRVAAVHAEAGRRLAAITDAPDAGRWEAAVRRLAAEAADAAGEGARIVVRPGDVAAVRSALGGRRVEVAADPGLAAGVLARSADGRLEVDATVPTRLARARAALAEAVAASLAAAPDDEPRSGTRRVPTGPPTHPAARHDRVEARA